MYVAYTHATFMFLLITMKECACRLCSKLTHAMAVLYDQFNQFSPLHTYTKLYMCILQCLFTFTVPQCLVHGTLGNGGFIWPSQPCSQKLACILKHFELWEREIRERSERESGRELISFSIIYTLEYGWGLGMGTVCITLC